MGWMLQIIITTSVLCRQTNSLVFVSVKSGVQMMCEVLYSELCLFSPASGYCGDHRIFCDLYKQTYSNTI